MNILILLSITTLKGTQQCLKNDAKNAKNATRRRFTQQSSERRHMKTTTRRRFVLKKIQSAGDLKKRTQQRRKNDAKMQKMPPDGDSRLTRFRAPAIKKTNQNHPTAFYTQQCT